MKFERDEIVIEFDTGTNDNVVFNPIQTIGALRGRFDPKNTNPPTSKRDSMPLPTTDLPGFYFVLSPKSNQWRLVDPLGFPDNKTMLGQWSSYLKKPNLAPVEERGMGDLPANRVATLWYWMKRFVDGGKAKLRHGKFVDQPKGRVTVDFTTRGSYLWQWRVGTPKFLDEVEHLMTCPEIPGGDQVPEELAQV